MGVPKVTRGGFLFSVDGTPGMPVTELAARVEALLADAVVELEALKVEVGELVALACTPPSRNGGGGGPRLLTVGQTAELLGMGRSTVHQMIRDGRLGSRRSEPPAYPAFGNRVLHC